MIECLCLLGKGCAVVAEEVLLPQSQAPEVACWKDQLDGGEGIQMHNKGLYSEIQPIRMWYSTPRQEVEVLKLLITVNMQP